MLVLIRITAALGLTALCLGSAPGAAQELVVAQVASFTSATKSSNPRDLNTGLKVYFDYINSQGGVNGRSIKLITRDDEQKGPKMVAATQELIADKEVLALVGYLNTAGLTEVAKQDLPGQGGIAMIAPFQGNQNIVGARNFFPFRSGYTEEIAALVTEAKGTQKKRLAIYYQGAAFGPSANQFAQAEVKRQGYDLVATVGADVAPEKFDADMKAAIATMVKAQPDAVLLLAAGRFATEFVRQIKDSPAASAQIYAMSVVLAEELINGGPGLKKARGVIIAQAVPFPFSPTLPIVSEYQRLMKKFAPNEALSFSSLEGFAGAKITVEALKRAGPNPTRAKILDALNSLGELNLGGVYVHYSAKARKGWGGVDLTIVSADGRLLR